MARRKHNDNPGITARCDAAVSIGEREFPDKRVEFHAYKEHPIIAVWDDEADPPRATLHFVPEAL